jgi:hypothetical protein
MVDVSIHARGARTVFGSARVVTPEMQTLRSETVPAVTKSVTVLISIFVDFCFWSCEPCPSSCRLRVAARNEIPVRVQ